MTSGPRIWPHTCGPATSASVVRYGLGLSLSRYPRLTWVDAMQAAGSGGSVLRGTARARACHGSHQWWQRASMLDTIAHPSMPLSPACRPHLGTSRCVRASEPHGALAAMAGGRTWRLMLPSAPAHTPMKNAPCFTLLNPERRGERGAQRMGERRGAGGGGG